MSPKIDICASSEQYFKALIEGAINNQKVIFSDIVKYYIIEWLVKNISPEYLLKTNDNNPYAETPLAIVLQQSVFENNSEQRKMLRFVGDYSLYVAGFFSESLNKKIIDIDYYINIGSVAFSNLSVISITEQKQELFSEMYNKFNKLVEVLTEVSFETCATTDSDLIRLYDRWLKTGSLVLKKILMDKGIVVSEEKLKIA